MLLQHRNIFKVNHSCVSLPWMYKDKFLKSERIANINNLPTNVEKDFEKPRGSCSKNKIFTYKPLLTEEKFTIATLQN